MTKHFCDSCGSEVVGSGTVVTMFIVNTDNPAPSPSYVASYFADNPTRVLAKFFCSACQDILGIQNYRNSCTYPALSQPTIEDLIREMIKEEIPNAPN